MLLLVGEAGYHGYHAISWQHDNIQQTKLNKTSAVLPKTLSTVFNYFSPWTNSHTKEWLLFGLSQHTRDSCV